MQTANNSKILRHKLFTRFVKTVTIDWNSIHIINCKYCNQVYIGETSRSLHERLMEHSRYASSPTRHRLS